MTESESKPRETAAGEPQPDDADSLTRRAQTGDEYAIRELVRCYAPKLFATAVSLIGNRVDAEDVVQETLLGMLRGLPRFRHRASIKTWLYSILLRQVARHRKTRGRVEAPLSWEPALTRQGDSAGADIKMDIHTAVRSLSAAHREVIVLRELEGLSYREISQVLNVKIGTVESRLARARSELRERLTGYGAQD